MLPTMPIPDFQSVTLSLLKIATDGGQYHIKMPPTRSSINLAL